MTLKDLHIDPVVDLDTIRIRAEMDRSRAIASGLSFAFKAIAALPRKLSLLFAGKHPA